MRIELDIHETDARALLNFLNADEGLRAAVVERLIPQNRPDNISRWTSVTAALGRLSAALRGALPLLLLVLLVGCDPVTSERQVGQPFQRPYTRTEYRPGVCVQCGLTLSGEYTCGLKFFVQCPYYVHDTETVAPFERTFESGRLDTIFKRTPEAQ